MKFRIPLILAALAIMTACRPSDTVDSFVRRDEASGGEYSFTLPLLDSLATYDIWIYTRIDGDPVHNLPVLAKWVSPSEEVFSETVYMDAGGPKGTSALYRSGVAPRETGEWTLVLKDLGAYDTLAGFGIICKANDGTR